MNLGLYLIVFSIEFFSKNVVKSQIDDDLHPFTGARHNEFDWALIKKVFNAGDHENRIISPILLKTMVFLLSEAAGRGTSTYRELLTVLPEISTTHESREFFQTIYQSLMDKSTDYTLSFGTKVYVDDFIQPAQKFASVVKTFYQSEIEIITFIRSREAAILINFWCSDATNNHINNIVKPVDVARSIFMIISTMHFEGLWSRRFDMNASSTRDFYVDTKSTASAVFMSRTDEYYFCESTELDAKILRLPYKGKKFAMYIILPNKPNGLDELISDIDSSSLRRALMDKVTISVAIPMFDLKSTETVHLNEILKSLGIRRMFTLQSSFPELSRRANTQDRIMVTDILQKTDIQVNEIGSTAHYIHPEHPPARSVGSEEFNANRPFLYFIEDETTGALIFAGKFIKPQ